MFAHCACVHHHLQQLQVSLKRQIDLHHKRTADLKADIQNIFTPVFAVRFRCAQLGAGADVCVGG